MTEPGDETAAADGRGRMRAARHDRDHAVEVLKAAFVQERLTKDELDARVSGALAARTYADLAAVTADIPADIVTAPEPAAPEPVTPGTGVIPAPVRTLGRAAGRAGMCLTASLAVIGLVVVTGPNSFDIFVPITIIMLVVAASGFLGWGMVDAWNEWRASGPAAPGPRGQVPDGQQADPGARRPRPDNGQTQASLLTRRQARAALLAGLVVHLGGRGILLHRLDPAQR